MFPRNGRGVGPGGNFHHRLKSYKNNTNGMARTEDRIAKIGWENNGLMRSMTAIVVDAQDSLACFNVSMQRTVALVLILHGNCSPSSTGYGLDSATPHRAAPRMNSLDWLVSRLLQLRRWPGALMCVGTG